jgi:glycosyltransferase involved in cell wall biosynthesis
MKIKNILCLALYGDQAASNRVRLGQYKDALKPFGYELSINSLLVNEYILALTSKSNRPMLKLILSFVSRAKLLLSKNKHDLLIVHCELFPFMPGWIESFFLRKPYIYDFDDAFYLKYNKGKYKFLKPFLGSKFKKIIKNAALVTAGNKNLANFAMKYNNNVLVLPSVVDTKIYQAQERAPNNIFTLGWIGSPSTAIYLNQLKKPLSLLGQKISIRLLVIGAEAPAIENISVESIPWSLKDEVKLINQFDVGLMPLIDDEWSRGKCGYKLIQCMACGVCVIASPVGSNTDVVNDKCGLLAESDDDWYDAILMLSQNPNLRKYLGSASIKHISKNYSLKANSLLFMDAMDQALSIGKT